jgi:hypothetical protein
MKKTILLIPLVILFFSSCATTGFLGFLATTKYVENKLEEQREELQEDIQAVEELGAELEEMVGRVQDRLDVLPRETIQKMIDILQDYLDTARD